MTKQEQIRAQIIAAQAAREAAEPPRVLTKKKPRPNRPSSSPMGPGARRPSFPKK